MNNKRKSRHGKNAPTTIKLSIKTDFPTWARVKRAAAQEGLPLADYLRHLVTDAVYRIPLTEEDYAMIVQQQNKRQERGI